MRRSLGLARLLERRSVFSRCVLGLSWWGRRAPLPSAEVNSAEAPRTRPRSSSLARELRSPSKPFVALALLVLLVAWPARSEPAANGTILLVVDARAEALATRVAAELAALGFAVSSQTREPSAPELASEARAAGAFAAIGIGPTAQGTVEITVLDRVTGKTVRREVLGRSLTDPTTRELVALRAAELLRASLMEIEAPHPPRGELPPTPAVAKVARAPQTIRPPERNLRLGAHTGGLLAPGLSVAPLLQASLGVRVAQALELDLKLGSQLTASARYEQQGRIEATARWLSVGPKLMLLPRSPSSVVALGLGLDFKLLTLSASGFAADGAHSGKSELAWTPALGVGLDSKIRIYKQLWWSLSPGLGFAASELALRADERDVRIWGRPWLECATGLEVEL
jgi:hypothetical protein